MTRRWYALLALMLGLAAPVAAQGRIEGTVVDIQGQPVPDLPVVLHGVTPDGGAPIAEAVSDDSGHFAIPALDTPGEVRLLFVAARWNGKVYLGPPLQPGTSVTDYVLEVGGTSADDMLAEAAPTAGAIESGPNWGALLVFLPLAIAIILIARGVRSDPGRERRIMLRDLARIEADVEANPGNRARQAERDALRDKLLAGSAQPAA